MNDDDVSREGVLRSMTGSDERSTRRRGVLGGLAVGAATVAGLSSPVGADTGRSRQPGVLAQVEVRQRFGDAASFERAFADHDEMLAELADRGVLDAASAADLEIRPGEMRDGAVESVRAVEETHGAVTPELRVTRELADGRLLTMGVRPERGSRWALVGTPGEGGTVLEDVTTMSCCKCCGLREVCCTSACAELCWECYCPDDCC